MRPCANGWASSPTDLPVKRRNCFRRPDRPSRAPSRPVALYRFFIAAGRYLSGCTSSFWGRTPMSTDTPAVAADEPVETAVEAPAAPSEWAETALTVLFTAAAVLF